MIIIVLIIRGLLCGMEAKSLNLQRNEKVFDLFLGFCDAVQFICVIRMERLFVGISCATNSVYSINKSLSGMVWQLKDICLGGMEKSNVIDPWNGM